MISAVVSTAAEPLDLVQTNVNKVVGILEKIHNLSPDDKAAIEEQRQLANAVVLDTFDFNVLSRRALGRNYKKFTEEEYTQFVDMFTELLFSNYYNRIKDYTVEHVDYVKEVMLTESKAEVNTIVHSNNRKFPVDYRLYVKNGQWRVYDVIIEGISMINNYRSQFNSILEDHSAAILLEKLRDKNE